MTKIELANVGVEFPLYQARAMSLKRTAIRATIGGLIGTSGETGRTSVHALQSINLKINAGDRVALLGHNGAGKTTLLRVLAGIYHPSMGTVDVTGRRIPLFDIGFGLDDEATGYENILLRGLLIGASRKEIESRAAEIADFTGLGDFLDMPLRTYSSGMLIRLLFAIATSVSGDILLMDEWLSAGDKDFIEQANVRLHRLVDRAHVLVLASHDMGLLRQICTRGVWMEAGRIRMDGPIADVLERYNRETTATPV
jgi:ABC-type polysaccharide/polyol phosphate transport system ATPase subunit